MADTVHVEVLGRVVLRRDGADVTPRGALQRRLLAALALRRGEVATVDRLADLLWPDGLPANHQAALQTHVFRLRQLLPDGAIESDTTGYRLCLEPEQVDAVRFEAAVYDASRQRGEDPASVVAQLDDVLSWWRGTPYEELGDVDDARIEALRLGELRQRATEERADALLDLGRHSEVVADLEAMAAHQPLHERPHLLLLRALAGAGRRADALAVYERYRRAVGDELGIEPSAALRELHDQVVRGELDTVAGPAFPTAAAAPESIRPFGGNEVIRYSSSFRGRDQLVAEVAELLGRSRLVTLVGTGGVGKTRLASEVCSALAASEAQGRLWFCELAPADASTVTLTVANALGVDERVGSGLLDRVAEVLRVQAGLLVLDNCEHVIDAAAELAEAILSRAPDVRILATSRERLAVDGEHLVAVNPLPVGEDTPAIDLFVDRAQAVRSGWTPTSEERQVAEAICRRLDGLPLAIELAAARLHTLTLDEVAAGLARRFDLLTGGRRTTARHRSLSAAIAWSYDLLEPSEQAMFDAVSVFQAPFLPAGAADALGVERTHALELLSALVERSLVHRAGERYGVYESLRQLGAEHLAAAGTAAAVQERHARHHAAYAATARTRVRVPGDVGVLRELDDSVADLRAAERWLAEHGTVEERLRFALDLRDYGFYRMRPEVLGWAESAARAAMAEGVALGLAGEAFAAASLEAWNRGDLDRGTELIRLGRAAAAATDEGPGYYVLENIGHHALIRGQLEDALEHHEAAVATAEAAADRFCRVESLGSTVLALGYADDPRTADAVAVLQAELAEASEISAAWAWYTIGEVLVQSDPAAAASHLARALDLADRCGASFVTMIAGASAASIEARTGDPANAIEQYRWLLELGQRAGVRVLQWTMLRSVAELLVRIGDHAGAATLLGAVTTPGSGHEIFGADVERLDEVRRAVRAALGNTVADAGIARGTALDDDAAAAVALAAFAAFAAS